MKKIFWGQKNLEYYKGLLIKADCGLHNDIANVIKNALPEGGKILDFGAGEGALSARLHDLGYQVVAVDKDSASFRCQSVDFYTVDFDSTQDLSRFVVSHLETFDGVLGVEVIEHVEDQWQFVRQLKSMLKPGGLL